MANFYVRSSDGSDADNGSTWALAKATLAGALAVAAAGDTIFVSDNHAETQASAMTLTSPGTAANPCRILCVDDSAEPPTALATTATVTTTGNSAITIAGHAYWYGIHFSCGSGAVSATLTVQNTSTKGVFEQCILQVANSAPTVFISSGQVIWVNCKVRFGGVGGTIQVRSELIWNGGAAADTGSVPTTLFAASGGTSGTEGSVLIAGVDLSTLGSGKNLLSGTATIPNTFTFVDCKLGSSVAITTGSFNGPQGTRVLLINCDSADTNYRYHKQTYQGTITQETTIVRTGGASDGTTAASRKMVSTANSKFFSPMESDWMLLWNDTADGSDITVTIPIITDNVTLKDDEAWLEVEYLGTAGFPLGEFASDRAADVLATGANQATDSVSSWTTTGLGTPVKQTLEVTFIPEEKGPVRVRACLAKASTTMYFDHKPQIS